MSAIRPDEKAGEALRQILELYDFSQDVAVQRRINGIFSVSSRPVVDRLPTSSSFCRGVEVIVEFDEEQYNDPAQGLFLFASILERFLSMYCSINSFTKMTARYRQGERLIRQWPPNAGEQFPL